MDWFEQLVARGAPSPQRWAFLSGCKDWRAGRIPPKPDDDDGSSPQAWRWIGYMWARGTDYMRRYEIAEQLNCDTETIKPRD